MAAAPDRQVDITDDARIGSVANPRRTRVDAQGRPVPAETDESES